MDESLSTESRKWITASALPPTADRDQVLLIEKEKSPVCVCFVESIHYSIVAIVFVIVLTLVILRIPFSQYNVNPSIEGEIAQNDASLPIDDYIDYAFDKS